MGGRENKTVFNRILLLLLPLVLMPLSTVHGETHLSGSVGADLGIYNFTNSIFSPPVAFQADRRLSNQFLDLSLSGPVVNDHFAHYIAKARFMGTQVKAGNGKTNSYQYLDPTISSYYGSFSFFTDRGYPVKFYSGKSEINSIRYEAANRSEVEIIDPGLAVVRRYETISIASGVQMKYAVNQDLELDFEAKTTGNQMNRRYDFDENRNIWVDFSTINPGVAPYYNIEVINTIVGHDVLFYADYAFIDTIPAGGQLSVVLEEGMRDLDFIPVGLNRFTHRLDLRSDMVWKIFFSDPAGSKDLDQANDIVTGKLKYENEGPFKTDAYFEVNDGTESVQEMTTKLRVFNNLATYDFNPNASISMLSNYSGNMTDVSDISHQQSKMFMNQTTGKWARSRGLNTMLSHSFFKLSSETGTDKIESTNNIVNALVNVPTGWNRHEVDFLASSNTLADSKGFKSSMYTSEMRNQLAWKNMGFTWTPKHQVKYSKGQQENPDASNNEWDSRLLVGGDNPRIGPLGALKIKSEFSWRRRSNAKGLDITKKYLGEIGLTRKFAEGYRLKVGAGWEKEVFDNEAADGSGGLMRMPKRVDEVRKTFRIDLQTKPVSWMDLGGNALKISTNESKITKFSASFSVRIPKVKIPIKMFLIKERRELEGVIPQTLLRVETKSSYNFRKIRMVLAHMYTDETLMTENYTYNEFSVKVFRDFDIF